MTDGPRLTDDRHVQEPPTPFDLLVQAAEAFESDFKVIYAPKRQAVLISTVPDGFDILPRLDVVVSCVPRDQLESLGQRALSAGMAFELSAEIVGRELTRFVPMFFDPVEALAAAVQRIEIETSGG